MVSQTSQLAVSSIRPLTPDELSFYHENGYVIVRSFFSAEEMEQVKSVCMSDPNLENALKKVIDNEGRTWGASVWSGLNHSLLSVVTQTTRMVEAAEAITGEPCYFMYAKVVKKKPYDQSIAHWHQAYPAWHDEGCPFPDLFATCSIAVNRSTKDNGCFQVIAKSHRLGRVDHVAEGNANKVRCEPKRLAKILERYKVIDCEMEPGDAVFMHANTIHGSQENHTGDTRILMHCHYNAMVNRPDHGNTYVHSNEPVQKLPDSAIQDGLYTSGFENDSQGWNWYNEEPEDYAQQ
ncbi:phytanoyl-CoA dioxygenase family protein [Spirulina sp. CCNP1310]|uniref:phytanoyl-CoA dioxygenase family protein n=1 Tax=Spirulina sp. CCNP1310 TaxID=3110249 RepID=UPI002B1F978B|nr:phytanoyl-CoA dioxygenase family protein [Spirulina sp. CCNP1310]MEA5417823.1 phytanoyl-CoA dioxygenase family protein [Spirulina sp. CCNP1310]